MDAIQTAFGHDTALCDRILAAASKFYLTGTNVALGHIQHRWTTASDEPTRTS
jgi:hypothetical protein